ncbi:MAG TPA: hypothetical protein VFV52_06370 [Bacilli bacterium]|nr:hypothetical protein [Bacilli bacterium]
MEKRKFEVKAYKDGQFVSSVMIYEEYQSEAESRGYDIFRNQFNDDFDSVVAVEIEHDNDF